MHFSMAGFDYSLLMHYNLQLYLFAPEALVTADTIVLEASAACFEGIQLQCPVSAAASTNRISFQRTCRMAGIYDTYIVI